jgi:hypothetical protein
VAFLLHNALATAYSLCPFWRNAADDLARGRSFMVEMVETAAILVRRRHPRAAPKCQWVRTMM